MSQWKRHRRRLLVAASFALLVALGGCSSKSNPAEADAGLGAPVLTGNLVSFSSELPARASVVYGLAPGDYDHVAYPVAEARRDLAYLTQHQIPLLDLHVDAPVYFRTRLQLRDGREVFSDESSAIATVGAVADQLTSTMVHIGWGDAHLLSMPTSGLKILIDAGETGATGGLVDWLESAGVQSLHAALSTHIHADHIGGFVGDDGEPGVLERFAPGRFFDSPSKTHQRFLYDRTLDLLEETAVPRAVLERGDRSDTEPFLADWDPQVDVLVLNSGLGDDVDVSGYEGDNINNESIVLRISYGVVDMIIGGDCETGANDGRIGCEESILNAFGVEELDVEYYKAHHHARYDGGSEAFVRALNPRVSLVPVSWKEYGDEATYESQSDAQISRFDRLQIDRFGIDDQPALKTGLTPRSYNITFATDGRSYEVRTEWALQAFKYPAGSFPHRCDDEDHAPDRHVSHGEIR